MADLYTIWADKEGDISDLDWVNGMKSFFDHLISEGKMQSYRITRCKMGFRSIADLPEFMILMEFRDMGQMDEAFRRVAPLEGELEVKHKSFNQFVSGNIQHALFRDFPDQFWDLLEIYWFAIAHQSLFFRIIQIKWSQFTRCRVKSSALSE